MCYTLKITIYFCKILAKIYDILLTVEEDNNGSSHMTLQDTKSLATPRMYVEITNETDINRSIHVYNKFRDETAAPIHAYPLPNGTIITTRFFQSNTPRIICGNGLDQGEIVYYLMNIWGEGSSWHIPNMQRDHGYECIPSTTKDIKVLWYDPDLTHLLMQRPNA